MKRIVLLLPFLLSSCWLPSTAEYQARKNRPAPGPEMPPFEMHTPDRSALPAVYSKPAAASTIGFAPGRHGPTTTSMSADRPSADASSPRYAPSPRTTLDERLRTIPVRFTLVDGESLREAVELLAAVSGLPLVVHPAAQEAALDAGATFDLSLANPIPAASVLSLITGLAGDDVAWTVQDGVVLVTTAAKARGPMVLASYDVRALTFGVTDFVAPRIDTLHISDGAGDDDRFGRAGETHRGLDQDRVAQLIEEHVAHGTWDDGGSINAENGVLFVRQTPRVQREVRRFLRQLGG